MDAKLPKPEHNWRYFIEPLTDASPASEPGAGEHHEVTVKTFSRPVAWSVEEITERMHIDREREACGCLHANGCRPSCPGAATPLSAARANREGWRELPELDTRFDELVDLPDVEGHVITIEVDHPGIVAVEFDDAIEVTRCSGRE